MVLDLTTGGGKGSIQGYSFSLAEVRTGENSCPCLNDHLCIFFITHHLEEFDRNSFDA